MKVGRVYTSGTIIKKARKSMGMTQAAVADLLNINLNRYAKLEVGQYAPNPHEITTLCRVLDVRKEDVTM